MGIPRKNIRYLDKLTPPPIGDDPTKRKIVSTIESLGLDYSRFTLVGSAALKMYNINPPLNPYATNPDGTIKPRPHDVDIVLPSLYWADILNKGGAPGGRPIAYNERMSRNNLLETMLILNPSMPEDLMPVDIIMRFGGTSERAARRYDKKFTEFHDRFDHTVPDTNIRILSLGRIATVLKWRELDFQAKGDLIAVYRHAFW